MGSITPQYNVIGTITNVLLGKIWNKIQGKCLRPFYAHYYGLLFNIMLFIWTNIKQQSNKNTPDVDLFAKVRNTLRASSEFTRERASIHYMVKAFLRISSKTKKGKSKDNPTQHKVKSKSTIKQMKSKRKTELIFLECVWKNVLCILHKNWFMRNNKLLVRA